MSKIILNMSKKFELIDSGKSSGDSWYKGLKFYKTKYDDVYITDYDRDTTDDLKKEGLMAIISVGRIHARWKFTMLFLEDENIMNSIIEDFYSQLQKLPKLKHQN